MLCRGWCSLVCRVPEGGAKQLCRVFGPRDCIAFIETPELDDLPQVLAAIRFAKELRAQIGSLLRTDVVGWP